MPFPPVYLGNSEAIMVREDRLYDPVTGYTTVQVFEGQEDAIDSLQQNNTVYRSRKYNFAGPVFRLDVTIGGLDSSGNDVQPDTWERITEWVQEDIRVNPKVLELFGNNVTNLNLAYKKAKDLIKEANPATLAASVAALTEPELKLYTFLSRGGEAHEVRRVVLRRRRTIRAALVAQSEVYAVESIFTTAQLIVEWNIPASIANKLPTEGDITPPYTQWGWKERHDTSVIIPAYGRAEEIKDWVFAAWSTVAYNVW